MEIQKILLDMIMDKVSLNGFWFLVCYDATQLALQLRQKRIHVVRSNKAARRIPMTESNGTPQWTSEFGFESRVFIEN